MWTSAELPAHLAEPGPRIVYANAAFLAMSGYTAAELAGETPRVLVGPRTGRLQRALAACEECRGETAQYRRDGQPFRAQWQVLPIARRDGRTTHFLAVFRDVTEVRRTQRRRRALETLAEVRRELAEGELDLASVRQRIVDVALRTTGAEGAVLEEPIGRELVNRAVAGRARDHLGLRVAVADSLSGLCYRELRTIACEDTARDERVDARAAEAVEFRSGVLVPLTQGYRCFGVLKVYAAEPGRFSAADRSLLELAAGILAGALRSAHTYDAEVSRRHLLLDSLPMAVAYIDRDRRLREVNTAFASWFARDSHRVIEREIGSVLGTEGLAALEPYITAVLRGEHVHFETRLTFPDGSVHYLSGENIPDLDRSGRVRGFFAVMRDMTGLQKTLYPDYLTELNNRRRLEEQCVALVEAARRYERPLSLVMLDVDHFKSINDRHGHAAGDTVLREIARLLREEIRSADLLARWGGEEFVIVAPETDEADAAAVAERIRARSRRAPTPRSTGRSGAGATASCGRVRRRRGDARGFRQGRPDWPLVLPGPGPGSHGSTGPCLVAPMRFSLPPGPLPGRASALATTESVLPATSPGDPSGTRRSPRARRAR